MNPQKEFNSPADVIGLAKNCDCVAMRLIHKQPVEIGSLSWTLEDVLELSKMSYAAIALCETNSQKIAQLFNLPHEVIELAKNSNSAAYQLITQQPAEMGSLSWTLDDVLELSKTRSLDPVSALCGTNSQKIAQLFNLPHEVIQLAKNCDCAAMLLVDKQPVKMGSLSWKLEDVLELSKIGVVAGVLCRTNSQKIAELFNSPRAVIELAKNSNSAAYQLITQQPAKIGSLSWRLEDVLELSKIGYAASALCNNCSQKIAELFNSPGAVIELAKNNDDVAMQLIGKQPAIIMALPWTSSEVTEFFSLCEDRLQIIDKPVIIVDLPRTSGGVTEYFSLCKDRLQSEYIRIKNVRTVVDYLGWKKTGDILVQNAKFFADIDRNYLSQLLMWQQPPAANTESSVQVDAATQAGQNSLALVPIPNPYTGSGK